MIKVCLQLTLLVLSFSGFAQSIKSANATVDSLREQLRQANLVLESTRAKANDLVYLLTAKEMALRSAEMKDSEFQVLLAIQAYRFNNSHKGNKADIDIYHALFKALQRFNDPILKTFRLESGKSDQFAAMTSEMAEKLCFRIKRNMTIDEWNRFSNTLPYESTCASILKQ